MTQVGKRKPGRHAAPRQYPVATRLVALSATSTLTAGVVVILASHSTTPVEHLDIDAANAPSAIAQLHQPVQVIKPAKVAAPKRPYAPPTQYYVVRSGDNLSNISKRFFGSPNLWPRLYASNEVVIGRDPNLITPGQRIRRVLGKHAAYGDTTTTETISVTTQRRYRPRHAVTATTVSDPPPTQPLDPSGVFSCAGLEQLWESAGGSSGDAFMAAEIGQAESSGRKWATDYDSDGTIDRGLWQINSSNGALSTYDAYDNARSAIILSDDGTNWNAWTTYHSGAYEGKC
jgi:LysM repeat protein